MHDSIRSQFAPDNTTSRSAGLSGSELTQWLTTSDGYVPCLPSHTSSAFRLTVLFAITMLPALLTADIRDRS